MNRKQSPKICVGVIPEKRRNELAVLKNAIREGSYKVNAEEIAEKILKEQNLPDQQFSGLPGLIEGSQGVLLTKIKETGFESRFFEDATGKNPEVASLVAAELIIPAQGLL